MTPEAFALPPMPVNVTGGILGAESGASFDEFIRSGRDADMTNKGRAATGCGRAVSCRRSSTCRPSASAR